MDERPLLTQSGHSFSVSGMTASDQSGLKNALSAVLSISAHAAAYA